MDEIIDQIAAKTGIDRAVARKAVGIVIGFLQREGPPETVPALIEKLPGAGALADQYGGAGSGLFGVFNDLTAAGLGMGEIQAVTREFMLLAKAKVGEREVDQVISAIPGLGQFV
jgi:hypothetical protein